MPGPPSQRRGDRPLGWLNFGPDCLELREGIYDAAGEDLHLWTWSEPDAARQLRALAVEGGDPHARDESDQDVLASAARLVGSGRYAVAQEQRLRADDVVERSVALQDLASAATPVRDEPVAPAPSTWFEVVLVDELGEPVSDVPLVLTLDGGTRIERTDADGRVRIDDGEGDYASVSFGNVVQLREALHARWRTIRPGEWIDASDDSTVLQLRESMPSVSLRARRPRTISLQPRVVLARLLGMYFELEKAFLLPSALPSLRGVKQLYDQNRCAPVLSVGHTDTAGKVAHNLQLSRERAASLVAYLTDAVDDWLAWYSGDVPDAKRWGKHEDRLMIDAMPDAATRGTDEDQVRWYQRTRGLTVDGKAGPATRRTLVSEYMSFDQTTLAANVTSETHGCGEHFPAVATGDGQRLMENRRVELFFFEGEIMPPSPGPTSTADSPEYPEWLRRARESHDFWPGDAVLEPLFVRWPQSTIALLPPGTTLRLEGVGIPKQELGLDRAQPCGDDLEFEFAHVLPGAPCSLHATHGDREVQLWCDQIVDAVDPPLDWCGDISELIQ